MAFEYRLESLLRLQRGIEHQEENRLLEYASRVAKLKADLAEWERLRLRRKEAAWSDCASGAAGIVLTLEEEWDHLAKKRVQQVKTELASTEAMRTEQMEVYRAARQKRETLESLRERQAMNYRTEQLREAQRELDDGYLVRMFYPENR